MMLLLAANAQAGAQTPAQDGDVCDPTRSQWLVCEGFEHDLTRFDHFKQGGVLSITDTVAASGARSLEATIASGARGDAFAARFFADHPMRLDGPDGVMSELFVHVSVRFGAGFEPAAGRLLTLAAFEAWDAGYAEPLAWSPFFITLEVSDAAESQALAVTLVSKTGDERRRRVLPQNEGPQLSFEPERWYAIALRVRLNLLGQADGMLRLSVDGQRVARYNDINYRDNYKERAWNHLMIAPRLSSPASTTQRLYFDELIASPAPVEPTSTATAPEMGFE